MIWNKENAKKFIDLFLRFGNVILDLIDIIWKA